MSKGNGILFFLLTALLLAGTAHAALYVYPEKGQSQEKMEEDKFQCYQWAVKQTGFNPSQTPAPGASTPSSAPPAGKESGRGGGVVAGAAIGGTIGLIRKNNRPWDRNAGLRGAATGALVGGLFSGRKRRMEAEQQQAAEHQQAAQQTSAYDNNKANYNNAYSACLKGRGYSVQ